LSLLETFYTAYTTAYCSLPTRHQLATLRAAHLTPRALAQFEEAANEYLQDGRKDYDLLIAYFDFDRSWLPSMKFTRLPDDTYQLSYAIGDTRYRVQLAITRTGPVYRIDHITTK
jgi:hypothetical protein